VEICLLGSLAVVDDQGDTVEIGGARLRSLLTVLALHCGEVVSDDVLMDAVWRDEVPARGANALQRQISTLRSALGSAAMIERRGSGYVLMVEPAAIDIVSFDTLAERGLAAQRRGDDADASTLLENALRLWRGEPLADTAYAEFCQREIARLNEARAVVLEARIDADLALGRAAELIAELEQLVLQYPLREHLRAQLMLALARAGRPAEALRTFQAARRVLGEELGLEPSAELRALETAILREEVAASPTAPPNTITRPTTNVRASLTRIIGRAVEIDALYERLADHRLVTLVGPGGVGKSRLAFEVAGRWLDARDGEVWIVELGDVERGDDVVPEILHALELPQAGSRSDDERRLFEYLCTHTALVVLDNCEHLIAAVAQVALDLLESCANLRICATSREGLAVPSEVLMPVPPLALDDAVALFAERARAADATFEGAAASLAAREAVAEICTRVDGLPLAIELAAARLRAMSVSELVAGLDDRFRVLNRGARTARPRQQTLRAIVDWSYDLLFDDERRVFERLSVFRGSCSLAAARVVCADVDISADDVAELIGRLVEKSLVLAERDEHDDYTRCRMLQTLADYGRDRLEESGDAERVYRAHVGYFSDFALRSLVALRGVKQRGWLRAVTANLPNLRAALDASIDEGDAQTAQRIAGCLGWYWWFTGRANQGSQWLELSRSGPGRVDELTGARVLAWSALTGAPGFVGWTEARGAPAEVDDHAGDRLTFQELDQLCRGAIATYERHPESFEELAGVELALSVAYSTVGDFARAHELASDAEHLLAETSDTPPELRALHAFAMARRSFLGDEYATAEAGFGASADLFRRHDIEVYETFALRYQARLALLRGDTASAAAALDRAVTAARRLGLGGFVNMLLADLAQVLVAEGDYAGARSMLTALLAAAREVGFLPGVAEALAALALVEWRAGVAPRAAEYARQGADAAARSDHREAAVYCEAVLGLTADTNDGQPDALGRLTHALEAARGLASAPRAVAFVLEGHAAIAASQDVVFAARLRGAADALRRAPGRAAGAAFAASALDTGQPLTRRPEVLGHDGTAAAFDAGAADPEGVVKATLGRASGAPRA
jgi:predicted ATPase/DNA-binding SARP family transcriptional activator